MAYMNDLGFNQIKTVRIVGQGGAVSRLIARQRPDAAYWHIGFGNLAEPGAQHVGIGECGD